MPDIKNNIKVIYNALAKEGYNDLGSEQEFAESMADENNLIWFISSHEQSSSKRKK